MGGFDFSSFFSPSEDWSALESLGFPANTCTHVYNDVFDISIFINMRFVYCKLVIIHHVPIFAIFVSALNDEFTY